MQCSKWLVFPDLFMLELEDSACAKSHVSLNQTERRTEELLASVRPWNFHCSFPWWKWNTLREDFFISLFDKVMKVYSICQNYRLQMNDEISMPNHPLLWINHKFFSYTLILDYHTLESLTLTLNLISVTNSCSHVLTLLCPTLMRLHSNHHFNIAI